MVLKAACEAFIKKFQEEAGFNPMEKCATIASACNHFWRRELVPEETIAIEPMNRWRGANVNQSNIALEWLCYEDSKLGGNRTRHVRNGGEQKAMRCSLVDTRLYFTVLGGKFGEKPNKTQTFTVTSPGELYDIIEDAGTKFKTYEFVQTTWLRLM